MVTRVVADRSIFSTRLHHVFWSVVKRPCNYHVITSSLPPITQEGREGGIWYDIKLLKHVGVDLLFIYTWWCAYGRYYCHSPGQQQRCRHITSSTHQHSVVCNFIQSRPHHWQELYSNSRHTFEKNCLAIIIINRPIWLKTDKAFLTKEYLKRDIGATNNV